MELDETRPVVAVFGSNSTEPPALKKAELRAAELVAVEINAAGAVLLTGADPPPGGYPRRPSTVKDVSIHARLGVTSGTDAPWVGVARSKVALPPRAWGESGVVLTPGWRDRRNFVEAALCDAAFAIGGTSQGTASEALFCLYLGRRLVVLTDAPEDLRPRDLRQYVGDKVEATGTQLAVDRGVTGAYEWADSTSSTVTTWPLPTDEATAARLVAEMLTRDLPHQSRPDIESLVDEKSWDRFVDGALRAAGRASH